MSIGSRIARSMIGFGALLMLVAVCFAPAAFGIHPDTDLRALGACLFSLGALIIVGGLYLRIRLMQASPELAGSPKPPQAGRTVRGGCDLCGGEAPVIHCRAHQLHLCSICLTGHYDARSCSYVPTTRTATNRSLLRSVVANARG